MVVQIYTKESLRFMLRTPDPAGPPSLSSPDIPREFLAMANTRIEEHNRLHIFWSGAQTLLRLYLVTFVVGDYDSTTISFVSCSLYANCSAKSQGMANLTQKMKLRSARWKMNLQP